MAAQSPIANSVFVFILFLWLRFFICSSSFRMESSNCFNEQRRRLSQRGPRELLPRLFSLFMGALCVQVSEMNGTFPCLNTDQREGSNQARGALDARGTQAREENGGA